MDNNDKGIETKHGRSGWCMRYLRDLASMNGMLAHDDCDKGLAKLWESIELIIYLHD